jgi:hypothetical protein
MTILPFWGAYKYFYYFEKGHNNRNCDLKHYNLMSLLSNIAILSNKISLMLIYYN